jgi:hypothetical protein
MRLKITMGLTVVAMFAMSSIASAAAVLQSSDYSGVTSGVTTELGGAAGPAFLLLGIVAGVLIAVRLFKKITGAKTA